MGGCICKCRCKGVVVYHRRKNGLIGLGWGFGFIWTAWVSSSSRVFLEMHWSYWFGCRWFLPLGWVYSRTSMVAGFLLSALLNILG